LHYKVAIYKLGLLKGDNFGMEQKELNLFTM
jgi:hypothetical protein